MNCERSTGQDVNDVLTEDFQGKSRSHVDSCDFLEMAFRNGIITKQSRLPNIMFVPRDIYFKTIPISKTINVEQN